jgi:hypothetical protein
LLHALPHIGKDAIGWDAEIANSFLHSRGLLIANGNEFRIRMLVNHAEEIPHVEVIEVNAGDASLAHEE